MKNWIFVLALLILGLALWFDQGKEPVNVKPDKSPFTRTEAVNLARSALLGEFYKIWFYGDPDSMCAALSDIMRSM